MLCFSVNPSPAVNFKRGISLKRFRYLLAAFHFRAEIGRLRARKKNCEPGRGVCEELSCQKARVGEGRELQRALVDVTGTGKTVPSCREKQFEEKRLKRRLNSPTVVKVFENKFDRVVEKSFESVFLVS